MTQPNSGSLIVQDAVTADALLDSANDPHPGRVLDGAAHHFGGGLRIG
ncbi:hypothetical protein [Deinococcus hopiensis]|nr:hypothetical protein [Deinococcus hopiensis]